MQSSDNCLSGGDICGGWPPDPKKECCEGGGMLTLPLTWPGGQPSGAWEQTPQLLKTTQRKTEGERKREREITIKKKLDQAKAYRTGLFFCPKGLAATAPPRTPWDRFHPLWVKMSRVETESRRGYVAEELRFGGELLPATMAARYSVHLPLCGHPSSSIVVTENESCSLWLWRHAGAVTATAAIIPTIHHICTPLPPDFICTFCSRMVIHSQIHVCQSVCLSVSLSG